MPKNTELDITASPTAAAATENGAVQGEEIEVVKAPDAKPARIVRFGRYLKNNPKFTVGLSIVIAVVAFSFIAPFFTQNPRFYDNPAYDPPSADHLLGTTKLGHDMLAQLAHGSRGSLIVGVTAGVLAVVT